MLTIVYTFLNIIGEWAGESGHTQLLQHIQLQAGGSRFVYIQTIGHIPEYITEIYIKYHTWDLVKECC